MKIARKRNFARLMRITIRIRPRRTFESAPEAVAIYRLTVTRSRGFPTLTSHTRYTISQFFHHFFCKSKPPAKRPGRLKELSLHSVLDMPVQKQRSKRISGNFRGEFPSFPFILEGRRWNDVLKTILPRSSARSMIESYGIPLGTRTEGDCWVNYPDRVSFTGADFPLRSSLAILRSIRTKGIRLTPDSPENVPCKRLSS